MCFNNQQPTPPQVRPVAPPPPPKPLQIAQRSTLPAREVKKKEKQKVQFGAKSTRDSAKAPKRDASSLLIPMNDTGNKPGGINV
mgnify:CR=1 FL=1